MVFEFVDVDVLVDHESREETGAEDLEMAAAKPNAILTRLVTLGRSLMRLIALF
jgi:hypothetical protein